LAKCFSLNFAYSFPGVIWNIMVDDAQQRLYLEVRNPTEKKVAFSALNLRNNQWLWKDVTFEEPWWVSLGAVAGDIVLFTVYTDEHNPDKKSLIAYHALQNRMIWWHNGFSLTVANKQYVKGIDAKLPAKETVLDLFTGKPVQTGDFDLEASQNFPVIRPFQYEQGTVHFDTVRHFLQTRLGIEPVATIEYLEFEDLIIMSVFLKDQELANYLYGFNTSGELLLEEKLGENLKGVGLDTFFILSRHLIFVKNKNELKSYKIL
jgi:hypothetical protein